MFSKSALRTIQATASTSIAIDDIIKKVAAHSVEYGVWYDGSWILCCTQYAC